MTSTATSTPLRAVRASLMVAALVCGWIGLMVFSVNAQAQPAADTGASSRLIAGGDPIVARSSSSGHGWAFIPAQGTTDGFLVHFVPRQAVQRASAGSVRLVMALKKSPLALAGWDGEAVLLIGPPGDDAVSPLERSVSTIKASGPVSIGNWGYRPVERLELKASLPHETVPRSMVGTALGPLFIWERTAPAGGGAGGELEVVVLDDSSTWRTLQPPPGFPASSGTGEAHALTTQTGVMIATRSVGEGELTLWRATPDLSSATPRSSLPLLTRWENAGTARLPVEFRTGLVKTMGASANAWLWRDAGHTLLAARDGGGMTLWRLDAGEPVRLWHSDNTGRIAGAMVMGGIGAATFLTYDPAPSATAQRTAPTGADGTNPPPANRDAASLAPEAGWLRVIEVSSSTGAVLADLPAHTDGFLSRSELQVLWLLFIGVGVVILLVVLRIDGPQELQLPEGTALASPLRRVAAGTLDVMIAVGVTSMFVGGTPAYWLSPATSASSSLVPLLSVIGIGCLLGTLGEATIGCSPGKLLVGARVLGLVVLPEVKSEPAKRSGGDFVASAPALPTIWHVAKPRFTQAFLRNAVRWFMPPMGMMMIVDNNWRHPGDLLARTVVVVRFKPESDPLDGVGEGEDQ